jgi:Tol biopolymer transport system component
MPARGGPARQLTFDPAVDWLPSWSPFGGREIAFQSLRGGENATWVVAAAGGEPRRMTTGSVEDWSPDGRWLAVTRQGRLFRVQADSGEPVQLSTGAHLPSSSRVSRDGRSIYYNVISGPREHLGLWKLSLADRAISRLTALEGQHGYLGTYFAADARYLYFTWSEDEGDIWVMDVAPPGDSR